MKKTGRKLYGLCPEWRHAGTMFEVHSDIDMAGTNVANLTEVDLRGIAKIEIVANWVHFRASKGLQEANFCFSDYGEYGDGGFGEKIQDFLDNPKKYIKLFRDKNMANPPKAASGTFTVPERMRVGEYKYLFDTKVNGPLHEALARISRFIPKKKTAKLKLRWKYKTPQGVLYKEKAIEISRDFIEFVAADGEYRASRYMPCIHEWHVPADWRAISWELKAVYSHGRLGSVRGLVRKLQKQSFQAYLSSRGLGRANAPAEKWDLHPWRLRTWKEIKSRYKDEDAAWVAYLWHYHDKFA